MHLRGVVVSELTEDWSHTDSTKSLHEWLREQNVPVITGVDTRALTKYLRTRGTMAGVITTAARPDFSAPAPKIVSADKPEIINPASPRPL